MPCKTVRSVRNPANRALLEPAYRRIPLPTGPRSTYPVGIGSCAIRPSIAPNRRLVPQVRPSVGLTWVTAVLVRKGSGTLKLGETTGVCAVPERTRVSLLRLPSADTLGY